jgi:hypothetical protein
MTLNSRLSAPTLRQLPRRQTPESASQNSFSISASQKFAELRVSRGEKNQDFRNSDFWP